MIRRIGRSNRLCTAGRGQIFHYLDSNTFLWSSDCSSGDRLERSCWREDLSAPKCLSQFTPVVESVYPCVCTTAYFVTPSTLVMGCSFVSRMLKTKSHAQCLCSYPVPVELHELDVWSHGVEHRREASRQGNARRPGRPLTGLWLAL